jgi:hypothetical protein
VCVCLRMSLLYTFNLKVYFSLMLIPIPIPLSRVVIIILTIFLIQCGDSGVGIIHRAVSVRGNEPHRSTLHSLSLYIIMHTFLLSMID